MTANSSTGTRTLVHSAVLVFLTTVACPLAALPQAAISRTASASGSATTSSSFMPAAQTLVGAAERAADAISTGFRVSQLQFPRVRNAYQSQSDRVASHFRAAGIEGPADVMLRVFKREQVLEVWARDRDAEQYVLVRSYPVCEVSGRLGPKRRQGDRQIPEGFYELDLFNPWSNYHLSMRVNYPNKVDRARGARGPLGGDIYVHGGCATIGCVPLTDTYIEELYVIAVEAREHGQRRIPIHIYPTRLDRAGMRWLGNTYGRNFVDYPFWQNLKQGYDLFERHHRIPQIGTDGARYTFAPNPVSSLATVRVASRPVPLPVLVNNNR